MSAASFLHSSFLQAVSAVMLWLVRVEKVPQVSEHLCPAKLQTITSNAEEEEIHTHLDLHGPFCLNWVCLQSVMKLGSLVSL